MQKREALVGFGPDPTVCAAAFIARPSAKQATKDGGCFGSTWHRRSPSGGLLVGLLWQAKTLGGQHFDGFTVDMEKFRDLLAINQRRPIDNGRRLVIDSEVPVVISVLGVKSLQLR